MQGVGEQRLRLPPFLKNFEKLFPVTEDGLTIIMGRIDIIEKTD